MARDGPRNAARGAANSQDQTRAEDADRLASGRFAAESGNQTERSLCPLGPQSDYATWWLTLTSAKHRPMKSIGDLQSLFSFGIGASRDRCGRALSFA
jgi:hypothetical protein